jgi:formate dehydrogenase major subunit
LRTPNSSPARLKTEAVETICNFCSIGCKIQLHHRNGFVMRVTGANGLVNKDGNLCRYPKFGYNFMNDRSRLTQPMLKVNGKLRTYKL